MFSWLKKRAEAERRAQRLKNAENHLRFLRNGFSDRPFFNLQGIRIALGSDLSLADIGTSAEELAAFAHAEHKRLAKELLMRWRVVRVVASSQFEEFLDHLEAGGVKPEDIRSSKEEIEEFRVLAYKTDI